MPVSSPPLPSEIKNSAGAAKRAGESCFQICAIQAVR